MFEFGIFHDVCKSRGAGTDFVYQILGCLNIQIRGQRLNTAKLTLFGLMPLGEWLLRIYVEQLTYVISKSYQLLN